MFALNGDRNFNRTIKVLIKINSNRKFTEVELLIEEHSANLTAFCMSYVKDRMVAEEIVSDVFLSIWKNSDRLESIANVKVYLYSAIKNRAYNYLKRRRLLSSFEDLRQDELAYHLDDSEESGFEEELVQELLKEIENLPAQCRNIFKLVKIDGLKYREVAALLEISIKTVETQVSIGIKKITNSLVKK